MVNLILKLAIRNTFSCNEQLKESETKLKFSYVSKTLKSTSVLSFPGDSGNYFHKFLKS